MNATREEVGATAAAIVYSLVVVIGLFNGVSIGEALFRGALCAAGSLLLWQFLGGIWLKAAREVNS